MASHSPKSSPTVHVNKWSEQQVVDWLSTVGLSKYARDFKSNGITGDVLVLLDDEALKDIGVVTIGQRLSLLSAIYRLKQQYGIPMQDGDWIPKAVEAQEQASNALTTAHMAGALRQRDDRIRLLESQILRLADYLARFQQDMASVARQVGVKAHSIDTPITLVANSLHSHNSSESSIPSMSAYASSSDLAFTAASSLPLESPTSRNVAGLVSPTRSAGFTYPASHAMSGFKPATVNSARSDSIGGNSPMTPTTAAQTYAASSTNAVGPTDLSPTRPTPSATPTSLGSQPGFPQQLPHQQQQPSSAGSSSIVSPTRRLAHQNALAQPDAAGPSRSRAGSLDAPAALSINGSSPFVNNSTSSNNANSITAASHAATEREDRKGVSAASSSEPNAKSATAPAAISSLSAGPSASALADSNSSDSNPYKSFRVTLDDPCYKVLPAALKKYRINDDWRKYALFICYGKTERCLSYDEKPLLLFQKLKENEQSPVFMLRHIRDVKSPIAIAEAKAATKLQEREGDANAPSAKKRSAPRADRRRVISGTPPPGALVTNASNPVEVGPAADLPDRTKITKTYAVAIYPYMPERDDEFDVNVGDTFVVINKAKGWWIVQRDTKGDGVGDMVYSVPASEATSGDDKGTIYSNYRAEYASGWVPAGCLLETSRPLGSIVDAEVVSSNLRSGPSTISNPSTPTFSIISGSSIGGKVDAKRASIPPALITSTSTPGIMLMDYQSAEGDLDLKKDGRLRVFKRYNHWSYCVQERDGHARGWVPSWYIGKLSSSSSAAGGATSSSNTLSKSPSTHALSSFSSSLGSSTDSRFAHHNAEAGGGGAGSPSYEVSSGGHDHANANAGGPAAVASM